MEQIGLWGWDDTNKVWVKILVNASGEVVIDPTAILENPPTEDEALKAATSEWSYDHWKNVAAHHAKYTDAEAIAAAKTVKLDDFASPDDNTDLNASTTAHGLLKKLDNNAYHFLNGTGSWVSSVQSGSTFPTSPSHGELFCHTPTGRNILYAYNNNTSTWDPTRSFGSMTVYVDKTDGTDDLDHGTGVDGNAFASWQYAVDCIPGTYGGNVEIHGNDEDYDETVTIQGKVPTGNYTITLYGTLTVVVSGTQSANGVQGTGGTQGSFTDVGNLAGIANKICYLAADGDYRIIDSTDGNTATICGTFTSQPLQNENYIVYDWGTTINSIRIAAGQQSVYLYDLELDTWMGLRADYFSTCATYRCNIIAGAYINGNAEIDTCYITNTANHVLWIVRHSIATVYRVKIYVPAANLRGVFCYDYGYLVASSGTIIDSASNVGTTGIWCQGLGNAGYWATAANGYCRVRNLATGLYAAILGCQTYTSNNQYSGNTVDETAVAASYGYID